MVAVLITEKFHKPSFHVYRCQSQRCRSFSPSNIFFGGIFTWQVINAWNLEETGLAGVGFASHQPFPS